GVHVNLVRGPTLIMRGDAGKHVPKCSPGSIDPRVIKLPHSFLAARCQTFFRHFFTHYAEPKRGIRCVPIRSVFAEYCIRQSPLLFETSEGHEQILYFLNATRSD